ncbi:hypothetical protein [Actinomadura opuntiae]|uniref:hypothetical protein n=1 Tax=Actinomadura sp. OS1-43 TaxID=604315 RepID=UPI00255B22C5|nr:hypothetical protein [Actinomadura sp. OS1-43]MDL4815024.1 hypothetical protein [Actinomadura sp. OS1-43]
MSNEIEVFGTNPVGEERFTAALPGIGLHAEGVFPFITVSRTARGRMRRAFSVEGPFPVEPPDLPAEVAARLLGSRSCTRLQ